MPNLHLIVAFVVVVVVVIAILIEKHINDHKPEDERKNMRSVVVLDCLAAVTGYCTYLVFAMCFGWN